MSPATGKSATAATWHHLLRLGGFSDESPPPQPASFRPTSGRGAHHLPVLSCRCSSGGGGGGGGEVGDWDWSRWSRHFSEVDQADSYASVLKFQLEEAIENEDFSEAAKLKKAILEATSEDVVAEVMSELKNAIEEQRYHDASRIRKVAGTALVGWWVGYPRDSNNLFSRIVRITPAVGRYLARSYSPKQLLTESSGTPLFEIFLVKDNDGTYTMKVVYLQSTRGASDTQPSSSSIPTDGPARSDDEKSSLESIIVSKDTAEDDNSDAAAAKGDENVVDQATSSTKDTTVEGLKSVINFLKARIPEFKVQLKLARDSSEQLIQEDSEHGNSSENSMNEQSDHDVQHDAVPVGEGTDSTEEIERLEVKPFIGGVLHNQDDILSKSYTRVPAEMKILGKDSFELKIPGKNSDPELEEGKLARLKVATLAAQIASDLMPPDVAKAFWKTAKSTPKISKDLQEVIKLALSQTPGRFRLSKTTLFNRVITDSGGLDPLNGLYVGAFSPYGADIVQLQRKYGYWSSPDEMASNMEFFEYVEAVKLTGDFSVPAGEVTFRAKVGKGNRLQNSGKYPEEFGVVDRYRGQGRIAEPGFKNPQWVDGELLVLNSKGLTRDQEAAELGFLYNMADQNLLVLFYRLRLPN